ARHRLRTLTRSHVLVLVGVGVMVLFLLGSVLWAQLGQQAAQVETGQVAQERDAKAAQAQSLAEQIRTACADGSLTGPVCVEAEQVTQETSTPPAPGPEGPRGEPGPGPTEEQIQAAVSAYLTAHPPPAGRGPTPAEVAAAVASYLIANPPEPGRPPTAEEIAAAVETYFARNPPPPGPRGADGRDGEPGRPPTPAEIRAAVDQYLAEHPPPAGAAGPPGPAGPPGEPPASFTMTFGDTTQTCTRSGGSDEAPTYTCSAPAGPGGTDQGGVTPTPSEPEETP